MVQRSLRRRERGPFLATILRMRGVRTLAFSMLLLQGAATGALSAPTPSSIPPSTAANSCGKRKAPGGGIVGRVARGLPKRSSAGVLILEGSPPGDMYIVNLQQSLDRMAMYAPFF